MSFWDRYEELCNKRNYKPSSEQAAKALGITRATISAWKRNGNAPTADLLIKVADLYGVSTDYLLCRSDIADTNDNRNLNTSVLLTPQAASTTNDMNNSATVSKTNASDSNDVNKKPQPEKTEILLKLLDNNDRIKTEGFILGLLSQDKYISKSKTTK